MPLFYKDAKGSFTTLVSRGLIVRKTAIIEGVSESIWEVTDEAIEMLKDLGFEVPV